MTRVRALYNIVLLTIDALRYDHCGFNGYPRPVTPRLDEFSKGGVTWDRMFSTGPYTPPAFCSMFTGTHPLAKGGFSPLPPDKKTIAEVLREAGFKTAGFTSNPLTSHYYNYERGFTKFFDSLVTTSSNPIKRKLLNKANVGGSRWNIILNRLQNLRVPKLVQANLKRAFYRIFFGRQVIYYVRARWITRRAIKWLRYHCLPDRGAIDPFFLWVHYMDTHDPFIPKWRDLRRIGSNITKREFEHNKAFPEYTEILKQHAMTSTLVDLYDAEARAVDFRVGFLVDFFRFKGLYTNTIFIITSDHGEEFNDHGDFGHRAHLYDELVHVPFMIFGGPVERGEIQGLTPGTRVGGLASLIQLAPTVTDITGIPRPSTFDASSLIDTIEEGLDHVASVALHKGIATRFNNVADRGIAKMGCIRDREYKYIHDGETGKNELYHLEADPGERHNLVLERPDIARTYHERCIQYLTGLDHVKHDTRDTLSTEREKVVAALKRLNVKL